MLLRGKHILFTGAARGIGLAAARIAQDHGAHVILADIDALAVNQAAVTLKGAVALTLDVANQASIAKAIATLGQLDGLVNNAATLDESHSSTATIDRFEKVMSVNAASILRVSQACLPLLRKSSDPAIVNTLSTQAFFGQANSVAYAAAKGAALNLTRCMAIDLAPDGIRVNGVAPGFIDTRMAVMASGAHEHKSELFRDFYVDARKIPRARPGIPEDCAGSYLFLLSDLSHYITGHVITVDGGLTATY